MSDLISRQAAIDAIVDRCNVDKYGRTAKIEELVWAVERVPSVDIDLSNFCDKLWRCAYERGKAEAMEGADRLIDRAELFNRLANVHTMGDVFAVIQGMPSGLVTV